MQHSRRGKLRYQLISKWHQSRWQINQSMWAMKLPHKLVEISQVPLQMTQPPVPVKKLVKFFMKVELPQALVNTEKGDLLSDESRFMAISNVPNGIIKETKRTFSDVDFISKGEQIYYEGKVYQATTDVGAVTNEVGVVDPATDSVLSSRNYSKGEVFLFNDVYYQASQNISKVREFSSLSNVAGTVDRTGVVTIGNALPQRNRIA